MAVRLMCSGLSAVAPWRDRCLGVGGRGPHGAARMAELVWTNREQVEKVKCWQVVGDCEVAEDRPKEGRNPHWFQQKENEKRKILMKEFGTVCVTIFWKKKKREKHCEQGEWTKNWTLFHRPAKLSRSNGREIFIQWKTKKSRGRAWSFIVPLFVERGRFHLVAFAGQLLYCALGAMAFTKAIQTAAKLLRATSGRRWREVKGSQRRERDAQ